MSHLRDTISRMAIAARRAPGQVLEVVGPDAVGFHYNDDSPPPCPLVRGELISVGDSRWAAGLPGRTGWRPTGSGAGRRRWG